MVIASRYKLQARVNGQYDVNGQKELIFKDKAVSRDYVEQRNTHPNNELWVIDEQKTTEYYAQREINLEAKKLKEESGKIGAEQIVHALLKEARGTATQAAPAPKVEETVSPPVEEETVEEDTTEDDNNDTGNDEGGEDTTAVNPREEYKGKTIEELREIAEGLGVTPHHKAKEEKIIDLILEKKGEGVNDEN